MKTVHRWLWLVLCVPGVAMAHPGHDVAGFWAGALHPWSGLDHLLAMIAVGIWATQCAANGDRKQRWQLPLAFVGMMLVGAVIGAGQQIMSVMEQGIAASVLVLGVLIARSVSLPAWLGMTMVASFAFMHGYAHGAEATGAVAVAYLAGMSCSTLVLHLGGLAGAQWLLNKAQVNTVRWTGAAIALGGVALLVG